MLIVEASEGGAEANGFESCAASKHSENIIQTMSMIHALAAGPPIFRGNCLRIHPGFHPFSVSGWLRADLCSRMPQALHKAE